MNTTGKKFGGRKKGTPNKITSIAKETLKDILTETMNSIDIKNLEDAEKIRLSLGLMPYVIPRLQSRQIIKDQEEPRQIEMIIRDTGGKIYNNETGEWEYSKEKVEEKKEVLSKLDDNDYGLMQDMDKIIWGDK